MMAKSAFRLRCAWFARSAGAVLSLLCWGVHVYQFFGEPDSGLTAAMYYMPSSFWVLLLTPLLLISEARTVKMSTLILGLTLMSLAVWLTEPSFHSKKEELGLKVVTANLQSWSVEPERSIDSLKSLDADVLLLQELWSPKHVDIAQELLPEMVVRGDRTLLSGTAVISRWPLAQCPLPPPSHCTAAILEYRSQKVLLVSVHGRKAHGLMPRELSETYALQAEQAKELAEFIRGVGLPTVVGGDFNSPTHGPVVQYLLSQGQDCFQQAGWGWGYTYPSLFPLVRLDRVFVSDGLAVVKGCELVDIGTDHRALLCWLEFSGLSEVERERPLFFVHGDSRKR